MTSLTKPPSKVIAEHLRTLRVFTDPVDGAAWPIYIGSIPDLGSVPDNAAVIYDTSGLKDGRDMGSGEHFFHWSVQIQVRTVDYSTGWDKISGAMVLDAADQRTTSVIIDGKTYTLVNVSPNGQPRSLGTEEGTRRRRLLALDFIATLKEA